MRMIWAESKMRRVSCLEPCWFGARRYAAPCRRGTAVSRICAYAAIAALLGCATNPPQPPQPLVDPIPERIVKGDLVVAVAPFVRAPRSIDPPNAPRHINDAYARIQYLLPILDSSGRLVFNDLRGQLYVTDTAGCPPAMYLDLRRQDVDFYNDLYPQEAGLLGFAFHPQFAAEGTLGYGKLYLAFSAGPDSGVADYLDKSNDVHESSEAQESVVWEFTAADPTANVFRGTSREVLRVGQFDSTHNVGTLAFNPTAQPGSPDYGMLYIGFGDGGGAFDPGRNGQNLATPLGAILRIDPSPQKREAAAKRRYGIPSDNPFVSTPGAAPEVWAYGLRHPQQFSWDAGGRMFIGDIGEDHVEEVNLGVAGGNYGWRYREGTFATAPSLGLSDFRQIFKRPADPHVFIDPVAEYDHDEGMAISGGFVYGGEDIPELRGRYLFTDIARGRLFAIDTDDLTPGKPTSIEEVRLLFDGEERDLVDVAGFRNPYYPDYRRVDLRLGIDHRGELYLLTKGDGWIRKLVPP